MESEASLILTGETTTTIEKSDDKSSTSNPLMVVRRKGDKIYYVKDENIWMNDNEVRQSKPSVQKASNPSATKETENDIINSESSVKTFTFDEHQNSSETEKCIEFWKAVMERNLQPIKANIIRETVDLQRADSDITDEKKNREIEQAVKRATDNIHAEYRALWTSLIQEIKANKLEQLKKSVKVRCQVCATSNVQLDVRNCDVKKKPTNKTEVITKLTPVEEKEKYCAIPRSKQKKVTDVKGRKKSKKSCLRKDGDCDCLKKGCKCPFPYVLKHKADADKETDKIKDVPCHCCQADLSDSEEEVEVMAINLNNDVKEKLPLDEELTEKQDLSTKVYEEEMYGEIEDNGTDINDINGNIVMIHAESLPSNESVESSVKSTVDLSQLDSSDVRKVSMILPTTGEVKVIERQQVDNLMWEKPIIKRKGLATPKDSFMLMQHQHLLKEGSKVLHPNYFKYGSATTTGKLSYKLPSGKVEVLEREIVEDTDWEMPKNYCKYPRSILASVPSLEVYKSRMSKSKSYSNRSTDDLKPILKNSKTQFQSLHYNSENSTSEVYLKSPKHSTDSSDSDKYSQYSERQSF
ncbi:uncharacterized protein LOC126883308 [Diabrotica virgifera virgifera]|uniref:Uncharacterized protein n=1 Tax=Diabrotica virgifera virgifera TaxID=50390 RepID=A0ABM5K366_DIAVI|nr:uncharacterized protein LOC126883308 [Diabrotica virgifera virgifera]